ncbi:MAG: OmpW family outer membrane protein [Pseudomonadales bacterium]|jgi:outer membrane protein|nr:OmpW family outer membrane protein [Pseudomonadales bacterium]
MTGQGLRNTARQATRCLTLLAAATAASSALAYEAGDIFLRAGPALVAPNDDSGALIVNGTAVPGTGVEVDDGFALGITLNYMLTPNLGVELLASTPFEHDINDKGLGIGKIAEISHLPPTLSLQYYPLASDSWIQPYVGVGVNYFLVLDEDLSSGFEAAVGPGSLEVDDSWGLAAQLGVDVALNERWSVNAALWYIDVETEATIRTQTVGFERIDVDVDVNPFAWMVGLSYRF